METVWKVGDGVEKRGESGILSKVDGNVYFPGQCAENPWCVIDFDGWDGGSVAGQRSILVKDGWRLVKSDGTTP